MKKRTEKLKKKDDFELLLIESFFFLLVEFDEKRMGEGEGGTRQGRKVDQGSDGRRIGNDNLVQNFLPIM